MSQFHNALSRACVIHRFSMTNKESSQPTGDTGPVGEGNSRVTHFDTAVSRFSTEMNTPEPETTVQPDPEFSLSNWFSRPLKLAEYPLIEGAPFTIKTMYPWEMMLSKTSVRRKLAGYRLFRGTLRLRFEITCSPHHYGAYMISYKPLVARGADSSGLPRPIAWTGEDMDFSGGTISYVGNYPGQSIVPGLYAGSDPEQLGLMARSCRPHAWIYPQNGEGTELEIPLVYPTDWFVLPLGTATTGGALTETAGLGCITIEALTNLRSTSEQLVPATMTVFGWFDDFQLSGPSASLQSGVLPILQTGHVKTRQSRETKTPKGPGIVEKTSSAIAGVSSLLGWVPGIGPLATAAGVAAGAIGKVAHNFGWTPHTETRPPVFQTPRSLPQLANADQGPCTEMLAVDIDNQTTVDPRTVGAQPIDELAYAYICAKPAFVTKIMSPSTATAGTLLFQANVSPYITKCITLTGASGQSGANYNVIQFTPMAHVARVHKFWRGSVTYRFTVLASQYHRGKFRLWFDPFTASYDEAFSFNQVFDITETTTFEFKTPWHSGQPWKIVNGRTSAGGTTLCNRSSTNYDVAGSDVGAATIPPLNPATHSGRLALEVFQQQTSPLSTADIVILVEAWSDDVEFAQPIGPPSGVTSSSGDMYWLQTGTIIAPNDPSAATTVVDESKPMSDVALCTTGEVLTSVRSLLRRACMYTTVAEKTPPGTASNRTVRAIFPRMPTLRGVPEGYSVADGVNDGCGAYNCVAPKGVGAGKTIGVNFVGPTYMAWFCSCYAMLRGGVTWSAYSRQSSVIAIKISRYPHRHTARGAFIRSSAVAGLADLLQQGFNTYPPTASLEAGTVSAANISESELSTLGSAVASSGETGLSATVPNSATVYALPGNLNLYGADLSRSWWSWPRPFFGMDEGVHVQISGSQATANNTAIDLYVNAAADFQCFMYMNPPTFYERVNFETPLSLTWDAAEVP